MLFAAVALRYAFPVSVYAGGDVAEGLGRSVTMQSLSNSLKVSQFLPILRFTYLHEHWFSCRSVSRDAE
jgi:hypothetical protein